MIEFNLTDRQKQAYRELGLPEVVDLCYGGAKGGGKSWFLCVWNFVNAVHFHNRFKLTRRSNVPHPFWMGRKQATDFTSTTLQTWQDVIPQSYYEIKGASDKHPKHILIAGTVAIDFGGLDRQEDINKFNSAEYMTISVDQAEETTRDEVSFLRASRRYKFRNTKFDYKGLFTANPAQCWLKEDFILNPRPGCRFIQALPSDNPHLPETYLDTLRESFGHRPEMLEAYLHGNWDSLEGADQVIKDSWIRTAQERALSSLKRRPRVVCDPARFGDDERVIYYAETTNVLEQDIKGETSTIQTARDMIAMSRRHGDCPMVVEEDGIGGGVIDALNDLGYPPIVFTASARANNSERYGNQRSEAWMVCGKHFADAEVEFRHENFSRNDLTTLIHQLTTPRYKIKNGRIFVEDSAEIKKRLGSSPDRATAYVLLDWSYDKVPVLQDDDFVYEEMENASYEVKSVL